MLNNISHLFIIYSRTMNLSLKNSPFNTLQQSKQRNENPSELPENVIFALTYNLRSFIAH